MWELPTNMHRANHMQNTGRTYNKKITKTTHMLTRNNQFGYKEGISTIDEITMVELYIEHAIRGAKIILMCLPNALEAINRTLLRETL